MPKPDQEAIKRLREWLPMGSTVYCIVRNVAASGMSRDIQLVYFDVTSDGEIRDYHPTHSAALAMGKNTKKVRGHDCITVKGCGMDMCWHLVNEQLAAAIWSADERAARKGEIYKVRTL